MTTKPEHIDPRSLMEAERLAWSRPYWPNEALGKVVDFAKSNKEFAAEVCKALAPLIARDRELSSLLKKHIGAEHHAHGAPKSKATDLRRYYGVLLTMYYMARANNAEPADARRYAAKMTAQGGRVKTDVTVKNDLTKARKVIDTADLPEGVRQVALDDWPRHSDRKCSD